VQIPNSSQIVLNDDRHDYTQNHLNDEIKYNLINSFTSYWDSVFESTRLVNRYWRRIFNIGNPNQNISWK
jgi:hypothetical protein